MAELIVMEKIDGNPVAWRCSDCRQKFSVRGKLNAQERHKLLTAEFKTHMEARHQAVREMAFAAGVPLPE
jgi:site-specific recombinase XerC